MELMPRTARAVAVTGDGSIVRTAIEIDDDAAVAARAAVLKVTSDEVTALGIAAHADVAPPGPAAINGGRAEPQVFSTGAAAVIAETWKGAARGLRHAVCLVIGERVTAGISLDGRPWLGAHGLAGAASWLALNPVERQDYRKFGSLAAEVSSAAIARRLAWRIQAGDQSDVLERAGKLEAITAAHVFEGARGGDGVAISVIRDTAKYIGMAVANLATLIDPDIVVLGGSVTAARDLLLDPVRQECARRLPPAMVSEFRCEMSPLGDDGIALGAARLAMIASA